MRTTLDIDGRLMAAAMRLSGLSEKTAVVHRGLEELIAHESARRLAALGGSQTLTVPHRRRSSGRQVRATRKRE